MNKYRPVTKKTFPVSLLMEDRNCLVVGGGPGIVRKLENLIHSGAIITVVSPELCPEAEELVRRHNLKWIPGEFGSSRLEGAELVYCGTNNSDLNRKILEECRERRILCCPIDKNWPEGDFTTPAIFRKDELSIAISTGGTSCRRSKLIKQSLARHVDMIDSAALLVIGTSHRQMDLSRRENYHLAGEQGERTGMMLRHVWGVHEFLILNTCNRVEIHAVVSDEKEVEALILRILGFDTLDVKDYYSFRGREAFDHSCTLLAGLYSQTPGENHIVAQIKESLQSADERGWSGTIMKDWVSRSLGISKKIRTITTPILKEMEIEDVASEFILQNTLPGKRGMILGTGVIAEGVMRKFRMKGVPLVCCYHSNRPDWEEDNSLELIPLRDFTNHLHRVDFIVAATASPVCLLHEAHRDSLAKTEGMILVDLSLPRNISPALNDPDRGIRVADLDDLKHWFRREQADMDEVMRLCRETIEENSDSYDRITASLESGKP